MLKISEMAKLANTTRRTLIFYDEQGIFEPAHKNDAGYRYYDYQQLYDLIFILGLRNLGLSLAEVKRIKAHPSEATEAQLLQAQAKIEAKINDLQRVQRVISHRMEQQTVVDVADLYQPVIRQRRHKLFWCSRQSVTCTEEEIAELFSEFYKQLDTLAIMDTNTSGFLTTLSVDHPNGYATASFRIIKEVLDQNDQKVFPMIEKAAGNYACILVENDVVGINHGLTKLKAFCQEQGLATQANLWQLNSGDDLVASGASKYGWLEYAIID